MKKSGQTIRDFGVRSLLVLMCVFPFQSFTQTPKVRPVEVISSDEEVAIRPVIPVCETEKRLYEEYSKYTLEDQVAQLFKEDSMFECTGVRGTRRPSGKHAVIQSVLREKRDEAFPELIKVVKKEKGEKSAMALDIIQHADDQLLKEYRNLFLKKSESKHVGERNRSLYILQRIRDEHIQEEIIKRWNAMSKREVEQLTGSHSLKLIFELMMYGRYHHELVEESILLTLKEKGLSSTALVEFLRVLDSFVNREHNTEIDKEVANILWKTKDETVIECAANVLSESRSMVARDALIRGLDIKDEFKRAWAAHELISRQDFKIAEDTVLLRRILSDESQKVIDFAYSPLTWKKPNAEQSAIIVECLLNELNQNKVAVPFKVYLMMNFYAYLEEKQRQELKMNDPTLVTNAIESGLSSDQSNRMYILATQRAFERIHGEKEMNMTPVEFWRGLLEK